MERFKATKRSPSNFYVLERDGDGNIEISSDAIDAITREPLAELGNPIFAAENGNVYHPYKQEIFRDYVSSKGEYEAIADPMTRRVLFPNKRAFSAFDSESEARSATAPASAEADYVLKGPVDYADGQWRVMWILVV